ncbi:MAG TPA: sulfatase-like hydrolase/transferase, partial [Pseudolabrys sp.]|nr:sulfatase-like hydrolase/transferase [Pseudolabrys sp.]
MRLPYCISRRSAILGGVSAFALGSSFSIAKAVSAKPNILFILADDLGYADVSCYGRPDYSTPNVDRIAAEGMRFMQAYANSAVCTASRVALITGRYQYRLAIGLEEPLSSRGNRKVGLPP